KPPNASVNCHAKNLHYISLSIPAATLPVSMICPFCFQWRQLGNHHMRLRQPGMNRELLSTLSKNRSTPGSAGKQRTPQSATTVSDSSSSKSVSAKPSPFARLKKILMLENKQQSKKGGLKDFLSSL
uniref:Uncharacterized protein n=1 Tax=Sinocyclocheilus grahami TaxID=75366 RepID=A0A672SSQ4_SINGR